MCTMMHMSNNFHSTLLFYKEKTMHIIYASKCPTPWHGSFTLYSTLDLDHSAHMLQYQNRVTPLMLPAWACCNLQPSNAGATKIFLQSNPSRENKTCHDNLGFLVGCSFVPWSCAASLLVIICETNHQWHREAGDGRTNAWDAACWTETGYCCVRRE